MIKKMFFILHIILFSIILIPISSAGTGASNAGFDTLLTQSWGGDYKNMDADEQDKIQTLFEKTFQSDDIAHLKSLWASYGFDLIILEDNKPIFVLKEQDNQQLGRGFYYFNKTAAKKIMIQAPHQPSDEKTGEIASDIIKGISIYAAGFNTVRRKSTSGSINVDSDLAHLPYSYFMAFSKAFARLFPDAKILQLHGFERTFRTSAIAQSADMIVSSGTRNPPSWFTQYTDCLKTSLNRSNIFIFPIEVKDLGALKNSIAQQLDQMGFNGFVHIEMSKELRLDMVQNPNLAIDLITCLDNTKANQ